MTNEQLVILIQQGHTEHLTALWKQTKTLLYQILYSKVHKMPLPNYITFQDLQQEMFFALCKAVKAYDSSKPYKFNSYLEYHIMNAVRAAINTNTKTLRNVHTISL